MRHRLLASAAALTLATGGLLAISGGPASAHCSDHSTHPDLYNSGGIRFREGANIRSHPHIDCPSRGQGNPGDGIDVHCYVRTGANWAYVRNTSTGVNGWTRFDALSAGSGAEPIPHCSSGLAAASLT